MKKFITIVLFFTCVFFINAQTGTEEQANSIIDSARNRIKSDTVKSSARMEVTAKNGTKTGRAIDQFSKDGPNGARTVIVFKTPKSVEGTRFLTMDNALGKSDQWIFLPSMGRVRRIASSESGGSFMGTDFSYDDISSMDRDITLDTHTILREEAVNGRPCFVIQSIPKGTYQYSKTITWIDKENFLIYKAEMYNRRGEIQKIMEMSDYKDIQGRLSPMQTKISTVSAGTSTTIFMDSMRYDDPIPENYFTIAYLETGR